MHNESVYAYFACMWKERNKRKKEKLWCLSLSLSLPTLISGTSYYSSTPLCAEFLAFSTNSFHLLLSWTSVFQFGTFSFCISFLTPSSQHVFGLPIGLFEMGFQECIALTILVSCILSIWPSHPNLCAVMKFTEFLFDYFIPFYLRNYSTDIEEVPGCW